jgi:dihydroorotate dehydrogenase electron transfer subunit
MKRFARYDVKERAVSNPVYADHAWHGEVAVAENVRLARDTYRIRFACPEIAHRIVPGQFLMLRLAGCNDPLLGRALAFYDVAPDHAGQPNLVDVVYLVVGKMTRLLAEFKADARLEVWGPLGNGFPPTPTEHLIMVAGGIGQTPLLALAREYLGLHSYGEPPRRVPAAAKVTLCYGVRGAEYLAGVEDFQRLGVEVHISTDDGSVGHRGLATDLIRPAVEQSSANCRIVCCGPEAMMEATAKIAEELNVPCQVSLESPMACGIGACFSCVKKIRDAPGGWDYRRTCVEGPVFNARDVEF